MTFQPEPTVLLYLDEAEVLKDVLGRLEDWLMHCDSATEANAFLAEAEAALTRGLYVDPHTGRVTFGDYAVRWLETRGLGVRAEERLRSILRTHVLPRWSAVPLGKIDHLALQEWVADLSRRLAPGTVAKAHGALSQVIRSAMRSRLVATDPTEGVNRPSAYRRQAELTTVSRDVLFGRLLPAVPAEHRALVCTAAGTGLRWGECVGLPWSAVDLDGARLRVVQVAVESVGSVTIKPCPKTRAGVRSVPLPGFLVDALRDRQRSATDVLVSATRTGTPLRRSNFRRQVWRPALVRAGLLGQVDELGPHKWRATWADKEGVSSSKEFMTERDAVAMVAERAAGGLRMHDLRHSYATWLVSDGVPINVVQRVMGHQNASATLNLYTHAPDDYDGRVRDVFGTVADLSLTSGPQAAGWTDDQEEGGDDDQGG
jgi:integrase